MNNDDITQKLALLPEWLIESNLQSWNKAVEDFGRPIYAFHAEYFPFIPQMREIVMAFSTSEQAELFRAEEHYADITDTLIISTTDGHVKIGEPYLMIFIQRGVLTAQYGIDEERYKYNLYKRSEDNVKFRTGNDAITFLQPMLDLLWEETRGKNNA